MSEFLFGRDLPKTRNARGYVDPCLLTSTYFYLLLLTFTYIYLHLPILPTFSSIDIYLLNDDVCIFHYYGALEFIVGGAEQ